MERSRELIPETGKHSGRNDLLFVEKIMDG